MTKRKWILAKNNLERVDNNADLISRKAVKKILINELQNYDEENNHGEIMALNSCLWQIKQMVGAERHDRS